MIRYALLLVTVLLVSCSTSKYKASADITQIFLVRHAEKADDGTNDPPLTDIGNQRAQSLSKLLQEEDINQVFSSDYKRTRQTALPTANRLGLRVQIYDPRDPAGLSEKLTSLKGQNILIVGHSNSTPTLANTILDEDRYPKYDESEYSNLIVITLDGLKKTSEMRSFH